jgi:hypothetical protein
LMELEATPGIEPGYTVLQPCQTAFMGSCLSRRLLISLWEN